jgi:hypothetical protein
MFGTTDYSDSTHNTNGQKIRCSDPCDPWFSSVVFFGGFFPRDALFAGLGR